MLRVAEYVLTRVLTDHCPALRDIWHTVFATAGLGADDDVFELIKQEVQRDVMGRKRPATGARSKRANQ